MMHRKITAILTAILYLFAGTNAGLQAWFKSRGTIEKTVLFCLAISFLVFIFKRL
jgi:hypothetical protein